VHLLLGIHHPLVWNRVLQHSWGWLLHILLWGLLRGRQCWGTWSIHEFFHLFKVGNLGKMLSIMVILTAKGAREVFPEVIVVVPPLAFIVVSPLGVLVPLVRVAPSRVVLLGVVSPRS
jgi:hypothetical protein